MTAAVTILCGPAATGKTAHLLARFCTVSSATTGAALWLGPTHRAVEAVREQVLSHSALLGSHLLTFQDFVEEIICWNDPRARPLSQVQRRLLAEDLLADLHRRGDLSHFQRVVDTRGFAEGMFALLAELKRNEIWPAQAGSKPPTGAATVGGAWLVRFTDSPSASRNASVSASMLCIKRS